MRNTHLYSKCNWGAFDFMGSNLIATCSLLYRFLPNRNSPKLPHPIFLPTRKLGPTISTELEPLAAREPLAMLRVLDEVWLTRRLAASVVPDSFPPRPPSAAFCISTERNSLRPEVARGRQPVSEPPVNRVNFCYYLCQNWGCQQLTCCQNWG